MTLLLFYLFLALFVSSLCSLMESVLLSTPLTFLKVKEEEGHQSSKLFIKLKDTIEKPLAAILTLNTVAHTIGAAGVGLEAAHVFGEQYFGLVSAVLTFMILIFSEIIPKTIGATYWKGLSLPSGVIIQGMIFLTFPLVVMSSFISKIFSSDSQSLSVSREEISAMAKIGTEEGSVNERESKIVQNIMLLREVKVSEIITPRVVVATADESMGLDEFLAKKEFLYFSRIPVYENTHENITGYVFRQTIFEKLAEKKENLVLRDLKRKISIVPETQTVLNLWEVLLQNKEHIALVVDQYGGMSGIITMEDIIESVLGLEIVDEMDKVTDMQQYAHDRWNERKAKYNFLDHPEI